VVFQAWQNGVTRSATSKGQSEKRGRIDMAEALEAVKDAIMKQFALEGWWKAM
jgi:hypothetical protein